ncbi:Glutamate receptor 2.5 [Ananas comosus]|uniref:Glutamate receptor n=1 Tax=Ananas comosus TaxID=4615 RepID=A0A199USX0_ANACO|nr:Glutamate receptor 2.5 [Ananas comosus]
MHAAISLINKQQVHALIGLRTWEEAAFVAEIGQRARVPILMFARTSPPSAAERWPFLVRVAPSQDAQMRAVAAVVSSWQWRRVTIIYEDVDYTATSIIPHLADALRNIGSEIDRRVAVPSSAATLTEKLEELKTGQCRVFVVHTSIHLAARLFATANEMNMMESSYVWIVTDGITSLLDSLNASTIAPMQGVLGVSNYFVPSSRVRDFNARFNARFRLRYPQEESKDPQFLPYLAYDTAWAVAMAMEKINPTNNNASKINRENSKDLIPIWVSSDGLELSEYIRRSNFSGLNGQFYFVDGEFAPPRAFQLVNVVGKSYRVLGFWSQELGFSKSMDQGEDYGSSMKVLGQVFWPGGPWTVPRGWAPPTSENPLKIAVPEKAVFPDFASVKYDQNPNEQLFEGFSIEVFREAVRRLPYDLPYKFVSFNGTYDCLMEHDHMKAYDVLVGDTSISSARYHYVEFSQPYTESGLVMVVPLRLKGTSRDWIFLKPFTAPMWGIILAIGLYNGLVVWIIERKYNSEFSGSFWNQLSTLIWISFTTLLSPGEKLQSNLSRVAMVVWLFVAVVLTTNYTASLSSLLTVQQLDLVTVESLKSSNAIVGCTGGSVVGKYLKEVLLFNPEHVKEMSTEEDFRKDLLSGEIKAAFLRISHAKLLLAKYCNEFTIVGPEYHVGGLGFVFPKGTPLLSDISQAILEIFETGMIQKLESEMLGSYNCSSATTDDSDEFKLSPGSFWGLFGITVFASTACLTVYGVFLHHKKRHTTRSGNSSDDLLAVVVDPSRPSSEKIDTVDLRGFSPDIDESLCTHFEIDCENQGTSAVDATMVVEDCAGTHQVIEESHT